MNIYIYQDLFELKQKGIICKLTKNGDSYSNDLFITFSLTNQTLRGIEHSFDIGKYYLKLVRSKNQYEPKIFIMYPKLIKRTPHINYDHSLCLYHPSRYFWKEGVSINEAIIPWTFMWIYFYEIWLETGNWYAPEHPHSNFKRSNI